MGASVHVRGTSKIISITPALASFATPYSSGDVLGITNTITNAVQDSGGSALLESIVVLDKANQKAAIDLLFFDSALANSAGADNAAYALNDADLSKCLGRVSVTTADYVSSGSTNAEATIKAVGLLLQAIAGAKDVYVLVVARGAATYGAATDLIIRLGLLQD